MQETNRRKGKSLPKADGKRKRHCKRRSAKAIIVEDAGEDMDEMGWNGLSKKETSPRLEPGIVGRSGGLEKRMGRAEHDEERERERRPSPLYKEERENSGIGATTVFRLSFGV